MDSATPISPPEVRLFFNRFVRERNGKIIIPIPNIPEFELFTSDTILKIVAQLARQDWTAVQQCRLLDDLGMVCLIHSFRNGESVDMTMLRAIESQNNALSRTTLLHPGGCWADAQRIHPLIHEFASFWRGMRHGPPAPTELRSEDEIARYLLALSEKTPTIVDARRLHALEKFLANPEQVKDVKTTARLVDGFTRNWFTAGVVAANVIHPPEEFILEKHIPSMPFGPIGANS